jgi:ATP-dependent DNA ligase
MTPEAFEDRQALDSAVRELRPEGAIAKRLASRYRPGDRGWVKIKNPACWRREPEREAMRKSAERRARRVALD